MCWMKDKMTTVDAIQRNVTQMKKQKLYLILHSCSINTDHHQCAEKSLTQMCLRVQIVAKAHTHICEHQQQKSTKQAFNEY